MMFLDCEMKKYLRKHHHVSKFNVPPWTNFIYFTYIFNCKCRMNCEITDTKSNSKLSRPSRSMVKTRKLTSWMLPEVEFPTCAVVPSEIGDFWHPFRWQFCNGLPSSDTCADSFLFSDPSFLLIPSENQFIEVSSPATRPRWSHRKLHVGEHRTFRCKFSLFDLLCIVLSLAATQQAAPIVK